MERGLSLKYLRITNEVWTAEAVAKEVHALRSSDEDADLVEEADADRANHLSLQPLYAKPPPVWLHPAFAAEFGDSFIGGTCLEHGAMHPQPCTRPMAKDKAAVGRGRGRGGRGGS